ncbi:hypothetical protein L2D08_03510 [Domibacillus sp. PGB-M46]|uniref:hypothetical protein n=1 Tax=Domibacillus sp. PGB-M46 TaxID=2910255 RepID=UPI001F576E12|nr:hypothetical protein [Domibacillus sp. PGB-M46]MCI2253428.1 hypothetical protein [Domibacillus sp. PGB-M46]
MVNQKKIEKFADKFEKIIYPMIQGEDNEGVNRLKAAIDEKRKRIEMRKLERLKQTLTNQVVNKVNQEIIYNLHDGDLVQLDTKYLFMGSITVSSALAKEFGFNAYPTNDTKQKYDCFTSVKQQSESPEELLLQIV